MWKLRVKIDVWSQGLEESLRQRNRVLLIKSYLQLPPRRVWLFVKRMRFELLTNPQSFETEIDIDDCVHGPEDIIAKGKCLRLTFVQNILT